MITNIGKMQDPQARMVAYYQNQLLTAALDRITTLEKEVNALKTHPPNLLQPLAQKGKIVQMKIVQKT